MKDRLINGGGGCGCGTSATSVPAMPEARNLVRPRTKVLVPCVESTNWHLKRPRRDASKLLCCRAQPFHAAESPTWAFRSGKNTQTTDGLQVVSRETGALILLGPDPTREYTPLDASDKGADPRPKSPSGSSVNNIPANGGPANSWPPTCSDPALSWNEALRLVVCVPQSDMEWLAEQYGGRADAEADVRPVAAMLRDVAVQQMSLMRTIGFRRHPSITTMSVDALDAWSQKGFVARPEAPVRLRAVRQMSVIFMRLAGCGGLDANACWIGGYTEDERGQERALCNIDVPADRAPAVSHAWRIRQRATIAHELWHAMFDGLAGDIATRILGYVAGYDRPFLMITPYRWLIESTAVAAEVCVLSAAAGNTDRDIGQVEHPARARWNWSLPFYMSPGGQDDFYRHYEIFTNMVEAGEPVHAGIESVAQASGVVFHLIREDIVGNKLDGHAKLAALRFKLQPLETLNSLFHAAGYTGLAHIHERTWKARAFFDETRDVSLGAVLPNGATSFDVSHRRRANFPGAERCIPAGHCSSLRSPDYVQTVLCVFLQVHRRRPSGPSVGVVRRNRPPED